MRYEVRVWYAMGSHEVAAESNTLTLALAAYASCLKSGTSTGRYRMVKLHDTVYDNNLDIDNSFSINLVWWEPEDGTGQRKLYQVEDYEEQFPTDWGTKND